MVQQNQVLIGFQAEDKPGIVNQLSDIIKNHDGNWHESRLCQLGGLFSGLIIAAIHQDNIAALQKELENLDHITITYFETTVQEKANGTYYSLDLIGPDRSGIIKEISSALAEHNLNIQTMETEISSAAMSGENLFSALITFSSNIDKIDRVEQAINAIADELTLDICLTECEDR